MGFQVSVQPSQHGFQAQPEETILDAALRLLAQSGYRKTWLRLTRVVTRAMSNPPIAPESLMNELRYEDDHGLLPWCFSPRGAMETPFRELQIAAPKTFEQCAAAVLSC